MLKRLVVGALGVASAGAVWMGVAGEDHTSRDSTGSITAEGQLGAFVTRVGDCLNDLPDSGVGGVSTVTGVSCETAHHYQVYYKGDISLTTFDETSSKREAASLCANAAKWMILNWSASMVIEYQQSKPFVLTPTQGSWDNGDRTVDCLIGSRTQTYYNSVL
jgi:hypothetical protein